MEQTKNKSALKVVLAAIFAVAFTLAMVFAILPATTLTASAEGETIEIYTNTKQSSYSSGCVTITVNDKGDGDGAKVDENRLMSISVSGNVVIKNAKVRIGYYYEDAGDVRSDVCDEVNVEGSGNHNTYVTFSNVNAKKITISTTFDMVQIDHVSLELMPVNGVTYELNGGSFNGEYIDYYFDDQGLTLPTNAVKSHYNFLGWYDNAELTGNAVTAIGADETGSKTFWAKWEHITNNITYNTNEGEWNGEYSTTYQETIGLTLPINVTKPHFTFAGWYSNAEFDGEAVTEITDEDSGDKEYWAKWEHITHNITYHLNGGEWEDGISAPTFFNEGERFELVGPDCIMPVKTGYRFYGWYRSNTLDVESEIQIIQDDETNDVELWAKWGLPPVVPTLDDVLPTPGKTEHIGEAVTVTATANENGFVLDKTHSITITFKEGFFPDYPIYLIVADGYEYNPQPEYMTDNQYNEQFITTSWGEVGHGGYSNDGINILSGPTIGAPWPFDFEAFDGSITVTLSDKYSEKSLVFKQIRVIAHHVRTVTYNENNGTMPEEYANKYLEGCGLELPIPTRNAYAFIGWYSNAEFDGEAVTEITVADTGDKVLYAKWEFIEVVDLSKVTGDVVIYDGQTITGELKENVQVTIADGATVTLKDAVIKGENNTAYAFAGITLEGDATLILEGENTVVGFQEKYPGIFVPENKTLTIGGKGTLDVSSNGFAPGIGAGFDIPGGNIVIEDGTINATGGSNSAGIGAGNNSGSCGTITIKGGSVNATGGDGGAGIGGGEGSSCGNITITDTVKKVSASGRSTNSIGAGRNGTSGTVTVGGQVYENGISDGDFVYFTATAEEFAELIENLGKVEYTDAYKEKLDEARELYKNLSDEQKARVDEQTLKVLTDAEDEYQDLEDKAIADKATEAIEELLPSFEDITVEDKDDVKAAREAYEALTDEQKAKVDPQTLAKLEAAEKEINDIETSTETTETINNLPATDEITPESKQVIEAARAAYDALSPEAKEKVSKETLAKLVSAEKALVVAIINEELAKLPESFDDITMAHKGTIEKARATYEALSDEQKANLPKETLDRLEAAEIALATAIVNEELAKLPESFDDITTAHKTTIEAARAAYEAFSDEQKANFPKEKLEKLEAAEVALVAAVINELSGSDEITTADKDAIEAARAAYEALSDEKKANFPKETFAKLEAAENMYKAKKVEAIIDSIGTVEFDEASKARIEEAKAAYDALSAEEKALVDNANDLTTAESTYVRLENNAKAAEVIALIASIGNVEYTSQSHETIEAARAAYNALTPEQQALVDNYSVLTVAETTYEQKEIEANASVPGGIIAGLVIVTIAIIAAGCFLVMMLMQYNKNKKQVKLKSTAIGLPLLAAASAATKSASIALYVLIGVFALIAIADVILFLKNKKEKEAAQQEAGKKAECEQEKQGAQGPEYATTVEQEPAREKAVPAIVQAVDNDFEEDNELDEGGVVVDAKGNYFNIRYNKSFMAKLIQSSDETKAYYCELKNEVMSYGKVKSRISWSCDSINAGRALVIKFNVRGKTLCVYFALNADDYADSKYKVEKVESAKYESVPCMYRIKNDRRLGYAKELIAAACEKLELIKGNVSTEDYRLPYETTEALIAKGLVKELTVAATSAQIERAQAAGKITRVKEVSVQEANALISDKVAATLIEGRSGSAAGKKEIVNMDVLSKYYAAGDTVTIESLKEKKLVPASAKQVKLLARGTLNKALHVELQDFSLEAVKMVIATGGTVKRV